MHTPAYVLTSAWGESGELGAKRKTPALWTEQKSSVCRSKSAEWCRQLRAQTHAVKHITAPVQAARGTAPQSPPTNVFLLTSVCILLPDFGPLRICRSRTPFQPRTAWRIVVSQNRRRDEVEYGTVPCKH